MQNIAKENRVTAHGILNPRFFHPSIPPRALVHGLEPFRIFLQIPREIRFGSRLFCGSFSLPTFLLEFLFNIYIF
jgi:hypothetical protein